MFVDEFQKYIPPNVTLLDLGAGDGRFALRFAAENPVVAVDKAPAPESLPSGITWVQKDAVEFLLGNQQKFGAIFANNILQFIDKQQVLQVVMPKMKQATQKDGVIAIRTFFQNPNPAFAKPLVSLFTLLELQECFRDWQVVFQREYETLAKDMKGQERTFFLTEIIAQNISPK